MHILDKIIDSLIYDYLKSKNYISAQVLAKEAEIKPLSSSSPKLIDFMKTYFSAYEVVKNFTSEKRPLDSKENENPKAKKARAGDKSKGPGNNMRAVTSYGQALNPDDEVNSVEISSRVSAAKKGETSQNQKRKPEKKALEDDRPDSSTPEVDCRDEVIRMAETNCKQTPNQKRSKNSTSKREQSDTKSRPNKTNPLASADSMSSSDEESDSSSAGKKANVTDCRVPSSVQRVINNLARSRPVTNGTAQTSTKDNDSDSDSSGEKESSLTVKMRMIIKKEINEASSSLQKDVDDATPKGTVLTGVTASSKEASSSSSESHSSASTDSTRNKEAAQVTSKKQNNSKIISPKKSASKRSNRSKFNSVPNNLNSKANRLLEALKAKKKADIELTRAMIRNKLAPRPDLDIMTMKLRVSLLCPLSKRRMQIPCRGRNCDHIQCFDAVYYLQMNGQKATWWCPVCNRKALPEDLVVDGLFTHILKRVNPACMEVLFHDKARWTGIMPKKVYAPKVGASTTGQK